MPRRRARRTRRNRQVPLDEGSADHRITRLPAGRAAPILFDEAEFNGTDEPSSGCCDAPVGPNTATLGAVVPGADCGRTGAVAISPFIKPGTVSQTPHNHYSTLRTIEDLFGLSHLGYANNDSVQRFGLVVFTASQR